MSTPSTDAESAARETADSIFDPAVRSATISILLIVGLGAFEGLAVAAALPQVAGDLGGVSLLPWVITTYIFTSGVSTVVAGALVDRVGARRTFRVAAVVFVAGGVACGLATSMPQLIAFRVVQGIGSGAANAVGLAAVGLVFPQRLVARAFAANATVWGAMSVAGPAIAAGLLTVASWRWIFLVNLPLGGAALLAGWRALPAAVVGSDAARVRIDPVNVALLAVFSLLSLLALDQLGPVSALAIAGALATGWLLLRRTEGREDALVRRRHVIGQPFGPLAWSMALLLIGGIGTQTFVPLYVSGARGVGAAVTAWSVLFFTLGWTSGAQVSSRWMERTAPLNVTTTGASIVAPACAAVGVAAWFVAPLWVVFALLLLAGFGVGTSTNSALTILRALAPDEELGRAVAAHQYVRSQGFAGGAALNGAVILLVVGATTGDVEAVRGLLVEGGGEGAVVGATVADALGRGFAIAALACSVIAVVAHWPLARLRSYVRQQHEGTVAPDD